MADCPFPFRIEQKIALTEQISEFVLIPEAKLPDWEPGAHVDVALGPLGTRSYSLISWPGTIDAGFRIAVQREEAGDGGSKAMHALGVGDLLHLSAPKNDFAWRGGSEPVLLLAGGIGVTPLISMATSLYEAGRGFAFHYAGRSRSVMAYLPALQRAFGSSLALHPDDEAPLDLNGLCQTHADNRIYICGPSGLIEAARNAAVAVGVPADRIHVEVFQAPAEDAADRPFEVEVSSSGRVFTIPPGQSIIDVLEQAGVDLIHDCQRGDCGICQVDVLSGKPDHRDVVLSQAEKDSGKVMQICVSRAFSDRLVLDI